MTSELPDLWYRLGSAQEQAVLEAMKTRHAGIVVPAHVFAYGRNWISQFLTRMRQPFFVDPMTYVFALPRDQITKESGLKKSWDTLFDLYEGDALRHVAKRPLRSADFLTSKGEPSEFLREFAKKTLELQSTTLLRGSRSQESLEKYKKILGEEPSEVGLRPSYLLAPYFFFEDFTDPWWKVNGQLLSEARKLRTSLPLYTVISTTVDSLVDLETEVKGSSIGKADGIILWVPNYSEFTANADELGAVLEAVKVLSSKAPTLLMYGGYFSLSLASVGLTGLISGICYGESKALTSKTTGGGMPQRYYVVENKMKYVMADARSLYSDVPGRMCGCKVCQKVREGAGVSLGKRPSVKGVATFFDAVDDAASKRHFLEVRSEEARKLARLSSSEIVAGLRRLHREAESARLPSHGMRLDHLDRWASAHESA